MVVYRSIIILGQIIIILGKIIIILGKIIIIIGQIIIILGQIIIIIGQMLGNVLVVYRRPINSRLDIMTVIPDCHHKPLNALHSAHIFLKEKKRGKLFISP